MSYNNTANQFFDWFNIPNLRKIHRIRLRDYAISQNLLFWKIDQLTIVYNKFSRIVSNADWDWYNWKILSQVLKLCLYFDHIEIFLKNIQFQKFFKYFSQKRHCPHAIASIFLLNISTYQLQHIALNYAYKFK